MQTLHNQSLIPYNTLGVNNIAKTLCFIKNLEDLKEFEVLAGKKVILGGGSNILIQNDLDIVGINQLEFEPIIQDQDHQTLVTVGSGQNRDSFVQRTLKHGYAGLENMAMIPGSVGAGALGNIGAYGKEVCEYIYEVEYIDLDSFQAYALTNKQCQFSYRWSIFKTMKKYFISKVTFVFSKGSDYQVMTNYPDVLRVIEEQQMNPEEITAPQLYQIICDIRTARMPSWNEYGTAGSFFKNPIVSPEKLRQIQDKDPDVKYFAYGDNFKIAAGYLLDKLGYRGKIIGKVGCYRHQALIIVNQGGSGQEVDEFAKKLEEHIAQAYGIQLEREVISIF